MGEDPLEKTRELKYEYSRLILPIGPVHPALKEPVHFKVTVKGEEIQDVALSLSHAHRGIEALAETRNIVQNMYLVERICGICSHTHTTCFVQAVEEIKDLQPPERALYLRTLIFELERIHSHLLWAGVMAYEMGFDTLFMYTWTAREKVLDLFEETTGNRVHHSMNIIGGVRWDLTPEMIQRTYRVVEDIEKACAFIWKSFQSRTAEKRLTGVGLLSTDDARSLCVVGPTARASGLTLDIRRDDPYAAYRDLKDSFSVALTQRPDHVTGYRLLAYAQLGQGRPDQAFETLSAGLARTYPTGRFAGHLRVLADDRQLVAAAWLRRATGARRAAVQERLTRANVRPASRPSLRFVLSWETDANDVDLHVRDARGGHAYYQQPNLGSGGRLYADVTTGYGPESFAVEGKPRAFPYKLQVHYYARGPMGYGMGAVQVIRHDGAGDVTVEERPFVATQDQQWVDLGQVKGAI